jgi:hypothetical protein
MKTKLISKFPNANNDVINYLTDELKNCENDFVEYLLDDISYDINNNPNIEISDLEDMMHLSFQVYYENH